MDISRKKITIKGFAGVVCHTSNIKKPKYHLTQYRLKGKKTNLLFRVEASLISCVVIDGRLEIEMNNDGNKIERYELNQEEGFHCYRNTILNISTSSNRDVVILVASDIEVPITYWNRKKDTRQRIIPFSTYRVDKPWGYEIWYTDNIKDDAFYSLKKIHMIAGYRSSLQSHNQKSETNYVVKGKAEVLYGIRVPKTYNTTIDLSKLKSKIYSAGEGWSNRPRELHRVIANETYTSIEVSTTELDDVIRWQDDTGRPHGRIISEHSAS